jgi:hypothetical protein
MAKGDVHFYPLRPPEGKKCRNGNISLRKIGRFSGKNVKYVGGSEGEICPEVGSDSGAIMKFDGEKL